jgi:hypothetical protein
MADRIIAWSVAAILAVFLWLSHRASDPVDDTVSASCLSAAAIADQASYPAATPTRDKQIRVATARPGALDPGVNQIEARTLNQAGVPAPARVSSAPLNTGDSLTMDSWATESEDLEWTNQVSADMTQAMHDLRVAGSVRGVSCRETLCRLDLVFDNPEEAKRFDAEASAVDRPKRVFPHSSSRGFSVDVLMAR